MSVLKALSINKIIVFLIFVEERGNKNRFQSVVLTHNHFTYVLQFGLD